MVSFESDYIAGAHPTILQKLVETNMESLSGYGSDKYCESAVRKIKEACECEEAQVSFLSGGTQTNAIIIDSLLKSYEGVIAADTGHISLHEAGAIEHSGHKVLSLPSFDGGKIKAGQVEEFLKNFYEDRNHEHMVFPGMVYISYPTEYGDLYSKEELKSLSEVCREYGIPLFIDGARLGYGLAGKNCDLDLRTIAKCADVFYIGATKVGALLGEAVVFTKNNMPRHFLTMVKQKGALLAKGRILGIQFDCLFTDNLYFKLSYHAINQAEKMIGILKSKGYSFAFQSPTNQQFIIMENKKIEELEKKVGFSFWEKYDETKSIVRFATSWSTSDEDLAYLENVL